MTMVMNAMAAAPQTFSDIAGQDLTVAVLVNRLRANQKLDCHLTFVGPPSAGKRTLAQVYAKSLVCDARVEDGSPCQVCDECLAIQRGSSFAYVEIDAATHGDDETVRTLLERDGLLNTASVRVVVINNAERLTISGADAALKTLERETKSVFLFLVNDLGMFAGALRSRCHVFHVGPVDEAVLEGHLASICDKSQISYERTALRTIVKESQRLIGRAVGMLYRVATHGAVDISNTRSLLGLGWGGDMLSCWQALLAGQFDESFNAFHRVAIGDPGRIRAMQAFLCELVVRDEVTAYAASGYPALDLISDDAWTKVAQDWDDFAAGGLTNGKVMRGGALAWWRGVQLDVPSAIAFQQGYEWVHGSRNKSPSEVSSF